MKVLIRRKRIIIKDYGLIVPLGISGPVTEPQLLDLDRINRLVTMNYRVYEVLPDGTQVRLTVSNFDKELGGDSPAIVQSFESPYHPLGYHSDKQVVSIPENSPTDKSKLEELLQASTKTLSKDVTQKAANVEENVSANKTQVNAQNGYSGNNNQNNNKKNKKEHYEEK